MKIFSIIITCVNETSSLVKTIELLLEQNDKYIKEIVIVYPDRVTTETLNIINGFFSKNKKIIKLKQIRPHVGGAVQDAFDIVKGEYTIMMSSDLETDPNDVSKMIDIFTSNNKIDLVTASRWNEGGKFSGYGKNRVLYNYLFNKMFAFFYRTHLTDMTFGYRGFKTKIVKKIKWENFKHSFFFETIVKPIRMNYQIVEIPTKWIARDDGDPQIARDYLNFIWIGIKNRFRKLN